MISHHELCFGCGQANLFGLQLEMERDGKRVHGRFFVKQDHQGPPGIAHGGIVATALDEAMALLVHDEDIHALTERLEIVLEKPARVGTFLELEATVVERERKRLLLRAEAKSDGVRVARALGVFARVSERTS
ncbi:MAG: PaaI family thioesterase [Thermoleophilaceae bacterium]